MYLLEDYGAMIADRVRTNAYAEAIARAVKPGDVVIDLGCGPGLMTIWACRAGARRVYAIEANDSIAYAQQTIAANAFADRVTFLHGMSQKMQIPERVNVVVSDIRGVLPLVEGCIESIDDVRRRLLDENGILIPAKDTLSAALVEAPEFYSQLVNPWSGAPGNAQLSAVLPSLLNLVSSGQFRSDLLLSESRPWHTIDYYHADTNAAGTVTLRALREGMAHGICIWFETVLFEGVGYSSGPGRADNIYGQCFLPLLEPVMLREGQQLQLSLQARSLGGKYLWCWDTVFEDHATGRERRFRQSTFHGAAFSHERLQKRQLSYVPRVSPEADASGWILQAFDGERSLQEIAEEAFRRFPGVFADASQAFDCAVELVERFRA